MKKILAICMAALLLLSAVPVSLVLAEGDAAKIVGTVDKATACPGEEIVLTVSLENNPGLAGWIVDIDFDASVLELTAQNKAETWASVDGCLFSFSKINKQSPANALWCEYSAGQNYDFNGEMFSFTFKVKEDAVFGDYTINLYCSDPDNLCNIDYQTVNAEFVSPSITVGHDYDNNCDVDCNKCEAVREVAPHEYDSVVAATPSCSEPGLMTHNCIHCGAATASEPIDATGEHIYGEVVATPSCGVDGYITHECIYCGQATASEPTVLPATGEHVYGGECDADCNVCGQGREVAVEHTYDYDCDADCNVCGEIRDASHVYTYVCDKICSICNELTNESAEHSIIAVDAKDATCYENGNIAYWYCEHCGYAWADEALTMQTNLLAVVIPMAHLPATHVEAKAPSCYENGNIEYWYCEACGQAWLDAECTLNTNLLAVILPMAHQPATHVAAATPSCTETGNIEYWFCEACGQAWLDAECTLNTNLQAVKLGASCSYGAIHNEGIEPGCHYKGRVENWYCANCDVYYLDAECTVITNYLSCTIPALESTATYAPAVEATCYENGNVEYWYCEKCEQVWADEALTQLTNRLNVVVPMGHAEATHVEAKAPSCYENGNIEYWYCADCGQAWLDAECHLNTNLLAVILPMAHQPATHVAAATPSCANGNIEYWFCEACGQAWLDAECTLNTNLLAVILPATHGHINHVAGVDATVDAAGNIEYWQCEDCEQIWTSENLTGAVDSIEDVIIPALGEPSDPDQPATPSEPGDDNNDGNKPGDNDGNKPGDDNNDGNKPGDIVDGDDNQGSADINKPGDDVQEDTDKMGENTLPVVLCGMFALIAAAAVVLFSKKKA